MDFDCFGYLFQVFSRACCCWKRLFLYFWSSKVAQTSRLGWREFFLSTDQPGVSVVPGVPANA